MSPIDSLYYESDFDSPVCKWNSCYRRETDYGRTSEEVEEITKTADALMLNLGNITDVRMQSMKIAAKTARTNHIPILIDLVGIACSKFRRKYVMELIADTIPSVIKGNYSEIHALYHEEYQASGVDAENNLDQSTIAAETAELALKYHTIVLVSGETDIITD